MMHKTFFSGMRSRPRRVLGAALLTALVAGCGSASSGSTSAASGKASGTATQTVNYGVVGFFGSVLPLAVARDEGFFAQHHLKVNFVVVGQSQPICQQLIGGALDMGGCSMTDTIQAIDKGAPLEMINNEDSTALPYDLVTSAGITSWSQLKGKTVMLGGPTDNTVFYFSMMAKSAGLTLKDFSYTYAGASSARFAALKSGAVAGTLLTIPFNAIAESSGLHKLSSSTGLLTPGNYAGGGTIVNKSWAATHGQAIRSYLAAYRQAVAWIYDPAHKAKVLQILEADTKASSASAAATYGGLVETRYWDASGSISKTAVMGAEKSLYEVGFMHGTLRPATTYYTTSYLNGVAS